MTHFFRSVKTRIISFSNRAKSLGLRTAIIWLFGHGIPKLTGVPIKKIGKQKLAAWGVNSSVNMRIEFDDITHNVALVHHCHLPTDDGYAPSLAQLQSGAIFIQQQVVAGNKVYIHCRSGIGRAPTMAIAYFVSQGYTLANAIKLIEKSRPFIDLTQPQIEQLMLFEVKQKQPNTL